MPQLVSTGTWFPFRRTPDSEGIEYILSFDPQCQFNMIMTQLVWVKPSIKYLTRLGKIFHDAVSGSPPTVRKAIVRHWLEAVVVAVAATEEYLTHITTGIERVQGSTSVLMSPDEVSAHHSLLEEYRLVRGNLWMEFRMAMNPLACKVDDVCLDELFLHCHDELPPDKAFRPGTILRLIGLPAEHKRSFFLEVVGLWDRMQNSPESEDIRFVVAASRLLCVTDHFSKTASYQTQEEAAAADLQNQMSATETGDGPEDQANDVAGGAEIDAVPERPSSVNGDNFSLASFGSLRVSES